MGIRRRIVERGIGRRTSEAVGMWMLLGISGVGLVEVGGGAEEVEENRCWKRDRSAEVKRADWNPLVLFTISHDNECGWERE